MLHIVVHKEAQTRGKDDAATPGPRFCCSARPFAEGLCVIVRGRLLAGLIGSSTHKEPKVCASKEDTILGGLIRKQLVCLGQPFQNTPSILAGLA